jgi:hypothetical protein
MDYIEFDIRKKALKDINFKFKEILKEIKNGNIDEVDSINSVYTFLIDILKKSENDIKGIDIPPPYEEEDIISV